MAMDSAGDLSLHPAGGPRDLTNAGPMVWGARRDGSDTLSEEASRW
jgi:hypothetical protein